MQNAQMLLCNWFDNHMEQFDVPPGKGLNHFAGIKPLAECILILYSFSKPQIRSESPGLYDWVVKTGNKLQEKADDFGANINWEQLPKDLTANPVNGSALFVFYALKAITGRPTMWEQQIAPLFINHNVPETGEQISLLFAADISGCGNCHDTATRLLFETIDSQDEDELSASYYLITHYIFYATKMGLRQMEISAERLSRLKEVLYRALKATMERKAYDLLAELVMCLNWIGYFDIPEYKSALRLLADTVALHGFVPDTNRKEAKVNNDFKSNYHSSLVALAALGHAPAGVLA